MRVFKMISAKDRTHIELHLPGGGEVEMEQLRAERLRVISVKVETYGGRKLDFELMPWEVLALAEAMKALVE